MGAQRFEKLHDEDGVRLAVFGDVFINETVVVGKLDDGRVLDADGAADVLAGGDGALDQGAAEGEVGVVAVADLAGGVEDGAVGEGCGRAVVDEEDGLLVAVAIAVADSASR